MLVITGEILLTMNTSAPRLKILVGHVAVDSVDEGHHGNHRRHADDDAEQRQRRAQLVRPQGRAGRSDGFAVFMRAARQSTVVSSQDKTDVAQSSGANPGKLLTLRLTTEDRSIYNESVGSRTGRSLSLLHAAAEESPNSAEQCAG